jgi:hypothetical protein
MKGILVAAAYVCFVTVCAWAAEPVAGSVKAVQGSCSIQRGTQTLVATEGTHLQERDDLITGPDGRMAAILRDGTRLSLGPGSRLSIVQFLYNPGDRKYGLLLDLGRGMLAYVSGKIASFSPESVRVQTPVGTLGLRGTKFVVGLGVPGGAR